jgi:hypothetical protein
MGSAADVEQLLFDLPELEVTETSHPSNFAEVFRIGEIDTGSWPVDVTVGRHRFRDPKRAIHLGFAPAETPGDYWSVKITAEQALHAAAMLVAAARFVESGTADRADPKGGDPS